MPLQILRKKITMVETGAIIPAEQGDLAKIEEKFDTMEEKIRAALKTQKQIKNELKTKSSLLSSALEQDADYYKANEAVKDAQCARRAVKQKVIAANQNMKALSEQIAVLKERKKDIQLTLNDYVLEYTKKTHMTTIEDDEKVVRSIKVEETAHIV